MNNFHKLVLSAAFCAGTTGNAGALTFAPEQIPQAVQEKFNAKNPEAKEVSGESITHFNIPLIKIGYKNGEDHEIVYYRPNGSFFVNGFDVDEDEVPLEVQQSLKKEHPDYRIKAAALIVNPNGPGREYEIDVTAAGSQWEIIADESGAILSKVPEEAH